MPNPRRFSPRRRILTAVLAALTVAAALPVFAEVKIATAQNAGEEATSAFQFREVLPPRQGDAGAKAAWKIVDGQRDGNGGEIARLHDDALPSEADQPGRNFFFAGGNGGRIVADLGKVIHVQAVHSYSWHPSVRGPQVYHLYGSDGQAPGFNAEPKRSIDPASAGWKLIAKVDTRPKSGAPGGQHGVSISDSTGSLGAYRHLLFDVFQSDADRFGQTFFSEIDVIDRDAPPGAPVPVVASEVQEYSTKGGRHQFRVTLNDAADLSEWARRELAPVVQEWYPRIVDLLPSEGYEAPRRFTITFTSEKNMSLKVPAYASGTRVTCNLEWHRRNLKGEAIGCIVHELVHVVQQYGSSGRRSGVQRPQWLGEGIPDYIRWFLYEPQSRGAEISARGLASARYDGNYRISANFLNWVAAKHGQPIITKLNAALRTGTYDEKLWTTETGSTVQELGEAWKRDLAAKLGVNPPAAPEPQKADAAPAAKNPS